MALSPVHFAYNADPNEQHLGFIAEDVPDLVATNARKALAPMDIVAVLTKTVQEQQRLLDEKDRRLDFVEERLAGLERVLGEISTRSAAVERESEDN